jgi:hypothetical protein
MTSSSASGFREEESLGTALPGATKRAIPIVILGAIALGVFLAWFFTPLSGDGKIFYAAARQADFHGNFPLNVYRSWELKPIGHRAVIYGLYQAATTFSDFWDKVSFERAVRIVYASVIVLAALAFITAIRKFLETHGLSPPQMFLTLLLTFFSMSYLITYQAEEFALIFLMASLPLALARSKGLNLLAGLPLAALFTLKGITVLLGIHVLVFLYVLGNEYRSNLRRCFLGFAGWLVVIIVIIVVVFPQELRDLRNATLFQGSLEIEPKRFASLPWAFWHKFQFAPVVAPAVILGWFSVPILVWHTRWQTLVLFACTAAVSGAVVVAQGLFFGYHYAVFSVPAALILIVVYRTTWGLALDLTGTKKAFLALWLFGLVGLLAIMTYVDRGTTDVVPARVIGYNLAVLLVAFVVLAGWLLFTLRAKIPATPHRVVLMVLVVVFAGAFWARYQSPWTMYPDYAETGKAERRLFGEFEESYRFSQENELLYLSEDGIFAYYFGAPTHCRYFTMEALVRVDTGVGDKRLRDSAIFRDVMACILSYQGEYILAAPEWAPIQRYPEIAEKMAAEYELVAAVRSPPGIAVYQRLRPRVE